MISQKLKTARRMLLAALTALAVAGCGGVPQMGGSEECMRAADALWTAVNLRQGELVDRSAEEITRLHSAGTLPEEPFAALTRIVEQTRGGDWEIDALTQN